MKPLLWVLAVVCALIMAAAGALAWLVGTQAGARWAIARLEAASGGKLQAQGADGTLARGVTLQAFRYADSTLRIQGEQFALRAALGRVFTGQLAVKLASARTLDVELARRADAGHRPPLPQHLGLPLRLLVERVEIERLRITVGAEPVVVRDVALTYEGDANAHRVRSLTFDSPWGRVALHGDAAASAPYALTAAGAVSHPDERYPVGAGFVLRGDTELVNAEATFTIGAHVVGEASATLTPLAQPWLTGLRMRASGVDLRRINEAWPQTALELELDARATREVPLTGTLHARNAAAAAQTGRLPVARLATRFLTDFRAARLEDLQLAFAGGVSLTGRAELDAEQARVDLRSAEGFHIDAHAALRASGLPFEASIELARFDPARLGPYPHGSLTGSLVARGALRGPRQVEIRWSLAESALRGHVFSSRGSARVSELRITRLDAEAVIGANRLEARGALGAQGDELHWALDAPRIEEVDPRVAGRVRAKGTLGGKWGTALVSFSAQASGLGLPGDVRVAALNAAGRLGQTSDAPLAVDLTASGATASNVTLERLSVGLTGTRGRHSALLRALGKGFEVHSELRGGWREPAGWAGEIVSLTNKGTYPLRLLAPVRLQAGPEALNVGRFEAELGQGRLLVHELIVKSGRMASRGDFSGLPASWLIVPAGFGERVKSTLLLDGQWSLAASPRLTGQASVRRTSGDLTLAGEPPQELGLKRMQLDVRFVEGVLGAHLQAEMRLGTVTAEGEISPAAGSRGLGFDAQSPLSARARLEFAEIRALAAPYLTHARVDGRLAADLQASGTLGQPVLGGTLTGDALRLDLPPHGVYLRDGRLRARLEGESLHVTELSLRGGEGELVAKGTLPLARNGERRLEWRATRLRLLARPDMRLEVSGDGRVRFDGERFRLTGSARADRAYIELKEERLPQLGKDVVVVGRPREPAPDKARTPVELDMDVDLGEEFALRGRGFDGKLRGRLRVVGRRDGSLLAYGKVRASDATYLAYGRKLEVDPGTLLFDGPMENPALDITAWRRKQAVEAGVQITGTAQSPIVRLVSKPVVPEGERLSWLVLGRAPSEAGGADLGLLQTAAGALLGRGSSVPITDRIARAAGLDEIGLRGGSELSQRVVAVGKRLSDRLYVSYEQGLGATATNLIKLDFSLTERLSVRGETGTSSGWGLFYRFSWD